MRSVEIVLGVAPGTGAHSLHGVGCRRHERRATLAVDFVGASQEAIAGMSDAALAFCRELAARCPGAQIAASSAARLPT